ncbi:6-chlorohydroxyquinol-1,2-dioxygenase, partial [Sesbania bispinosa]
EVVVDDKLMDDPDWTCGDCGGSGALRWDGEGSFAYPHIPKRHNVPKGHLCPHLPQFKML